MNMSLSTTFYFSLLPLFFLQMSSHRLMCSISSLSCFSFFLPPFSLFLSAPLKDDYVIGKELGRGRFSVVCECVNKVTGEHAAVKIIDKTTIEPEEKGLLRTEIAGKERIFSDIDKSMNKN